MASGASPRRRKTVPKNRGIGDRFRRSLREAPSRSSRSSSPQRPLLPRLVVFLVWLVAVSALAGLVYWGRSAKPERSPRTQVAAKESGHGAGKTFDHREPTKTKDAPRPRTSAKPDSGQSTITVDKPGAESQESSIPKKTPDGNRHETHTGDLHAALGPESNSKEPSKLIPLPQHPPLTPPIAKVAIVIDDFGQDLEIAKKFLELPLAITFSVLPYLRHSREIAELVHGHHRQVILHLPMEPQGYPKVNPGKGALLLSMSGDAMQQSLLAALDTSPYFAGLNNHMGSHFTENATVMKTVLEEAQKRRLYFVDSFTSPRSMAASVAQELQIPFRRRDIFLDNSLSEHAIRAQLRQVMRRAKIQGSALAIGHPREATLRALRQEIDAFEREKIAVVPAGDLMSGS